MNVWGCGDGCGVWSLHCWGCGHCIVGGVEMGVVIALVGVC